MLSGKSFHSLDAKNRLIIPHNHRLELGLALYATVGYDNNLIIMSKAVYEATAEKIAHSSSEFLEENRELRRDFFGNVAYCEIDKAGRILIPQYLLDLAGISKEVAERNLFRSAPLQGLSKPASCGAGLLLCGLATGMLFRLFRGSRQLCKRVWER